MSLSTGRTPLYKSLYVQVLAAVIFGVLLGHFFPQTGAEMKPLGDAFIKLIKMIIAPIIFCTVVSGIAGMRAVRRQCGERFDVLLQLQVSARANLLSAFIPARVRVGFDAARSKDLHGLFVNTRIPDRPGIHVLDALGSFCEPLGLRQDHVDWRDMPVPAEISPTPSCVAIWLETREAE